MTLVFFESLGLRGLVLAGAGLLLSGCATRQLKAGPNSCAYALSDLRTTWANLQTARREPNGCTGANAGRCEQYRSRIEYLGQNCPVSQETLLAGAILAFDERNLPKAQSYLDNLLSTYRTDPDAATLRGMIAIEEGNIPFALRFLGEQIQVTGDHSGLREVYAAALYLSGDYPEALLQLGRAAKFGAPIWRIDYGLGLIAEAMRDLPEARKRYEAALSTRPGWTLPIGRLRALGTSGR